MHLTCSVVQQVCRGEPHRYGGPDTGNVLTWTAVYSPNHTASHRDMDKKLKSLHTRTHTDKHTRTHTHIHKSKHINSDILDSYTDTHTIILIYTAKLLI